jgi:hypothetical protein
VLLLFCMKSKEPSQPEPSSIQKWGVMADYLIEIEQYLEWTQRQSMTSWINDYAEKNNKQPSSIWRLLTAGKYYRELRGRFEVKGILLPALTEPELMASPESLEILKKIGRTEPPQLEEIEEQTLLGKLSRKELRALWETYRPVLGKRTARGRNQPEPRYRRHDEQMRTAHVKAGAIDAIRKSGTAWLGADKPYIYKVLSRKGVEELEQLADPMPDAFILHAPHPESEITIHSVFVQAVPTEQRNLEDVRHVSGMDRLWIATPREAMTSPSKDFPEWAGHIRVTGEEITVMRDAKPSKRKSDKEGAILRALLKVGFRPE